jgi:hypothetical protein
LQPVVESQPTDWFQRHSLGLNTRLREEELGNLGMLGTQLDQLGVAARRTILEGSFMPEAVARNIANAARILKQIIDEGQQGSGMSSVTVRASQVEDLWDVAYGATREGTTPDAAGGSPAAPAGTARRYNSSTGQIE